MGVIFDEKPLTATRAKKTSFLAGLILKTGIVKTEKGAQVVMLIITIGAFFLMVVLLPDVLKTPAPTRGVPVHSNVYKMP
jgi:hypothetical protein